MDTSMRMLKIYVSNTDKLMGKSVYEGLAYEAKNFGLAGVTVYRGIMGYGKSSQMHSEKFWEISDKIPVVLEFVDVPEKIEGFLALIRPLVEKLPKGCLISTQDVDVVLQKQGIIAGGL